MVRAVLWGVLTCAVAPACGNKDSVPAAQPGAVAGKVLEVSGSVNVGGKALAVGDAVKTDDTIVTGADGNVAIELAHNNARWELGPNHKGRPMDAPVWSAAKRDKAGAVDQDTSAAGRPAERSAANSAASSEKTGMPGGPPKTETARAVPEAPAVEQAPKAAIAAPTVQPDPAPPPPPPADKDVAPSGGTVGGEGGGGGGSRGRDAPKAMVAKKTIDPKLEPLAKCLVPGKSLELTVHIVDHVPQLKIAGATAEVEKCLTDRAKKIVLTAATGDFTFTLSR